MTMFFTIQPRKLKALLVALLLVLAIAGSLVAYAWQWVHAPLRLQAANTWPLTFSINIGASAKTAAQQIKLAGLDLQPLWFAWLARWQQRAHLIKAGSYELIGAVTPLQLLDKLTSGDVTHQQIAIIEGWTFAQMRAALDAAAEVSHDTAGLSEADLLQKLALPIPYAEGQFFPDTYRFDKGASDITILRRAYQAMQRRLQQAWTDRQADLPYASAEEALIMASIIEKETGQAADRGKVAAVFVNRLKKGMLLQTDPTVIYGLGIHFDGNLRKVDLQTDTPYNTYTRTGLPPTPIALPSAAALQAALHPEPIEALYFVARGDGSSEFSNTLADHQNAVNKFQTKVIKKK